MHSSKHVLELQGASRCCPSQVGTFHKNHDILATVPNLPGPEARNLEGTEHPLLEQCQQYCLRYPLDRTKQRRHYVVDSHSEKPSVRAKGAVPRPATHEIHIRSRLGCSVTHYLVDQNHSDGRDARHCSFPNLWKIQAKIVACRLRCPRMLPKLQ